MTQDLVGLVLFFLNEGEISRKTTTHFEKSKINFLFVCLFMKAHLLASNGPTAPKGTELPESSKPEAGSPPDL